MFGKLLFTRVYELTCYGHCGLGETISWAEITKDEAIKELIKELGWQRIKGQWYCKGCAKIKVK